MNSKEPVLTLEGVTKIFPGVRAVADVSFELYPGQVTALIGENGAGKSTIVKILTGIYFPDQGRIIVNDRDCRFPSPRASWDAGIVAIHQETVMFDELTVAENIFMGHMPVGLGKLIDWKTIQDKSTELLKRIDADFSSDMKVKQLSVAQKHMVEIARALSHEARVIIMDEPTAALSRHEIDDLFRLINQLKEQGRAIVFISHKFDEIFRVSDRYVCLRDGEKVGDGAISEVTEPELVRMMVGRPIEQVFPKRDIEIGETVLEVRDLSNATEYADISFSLRKGEILGLYGLVGAGRSEAMQGLFGISPVTRGEIKVGGQELRIRSAIDAIEAGISYVPEDRQMQGAVLPLGIRENTTLASLLDHVRGVFLSRPSELAKTRALGSRLSVKAAHWEQKLEELSGGNQQKVVIAKWLATKPRIIILDEPTKGIDVGSKAAVHDFIGELAEEGLAVILISSELPEVMGLADRILVLHEGRIVEEFGRRNWSAEKIVAAATGAKVEAA